MVSIVVYTLKADQEGPIVAIGLVVRYGSVAIGVYAAILLCAILVQRLARTTQARFSGGWDRRLWIVWMWAVVFVAMGLFPPTRYRSGWDVGETVGFRFLLSDSGGIVLSRLLIQWAIVTAVAGAAIISMTWRKSERQAA